VIPGCIDCGTAAAGIQAESNPIGRACCAFPEEQAETEMFPMTKKLKPASTEPEQDSTPATEIEATEPQAAPEEEDAAELEAQIDAAEEETGEDAEDEAEEEAEDDSADGEEAEEPADEEGEDEEPEFTPKPRPPVKLERLQKILAKAGVASRRKAEEMIEQGRVQLNGKVVTELGTKADMGRDHIRVDGKLLQGAERLRYFVLNKPKGFVTTVKDPEGRPTVMQFFDKMKERLYPVGRLDYMSEGLLVVTNDGELANRLTKAASGVEKTYLVKVAGQPTESELDILRGGVAIERGKPGSSKVRTSPARIRQVRQGDNPWYEVVLIEGRNRELRKMFEEIGHFVEKIRRVGYGPLVLDQEPGNLRELQPEELEALRLAAEGKLRTPKSKELRRRNKMDAAGLPTVKPKPTVHPRPVRPFPAPPSEERSAGAGRPGEFRPKRTFGEDRPSRPARPSGGEFRPAAGRPAGGPARYGSTRPDSGPAKRPFRREEGEGSSTPRPARPAFGKDARPARPDFKRDDRPARPPARFDSSASRPPSDRPRPTSAGTGRTSSGSNFGAKPAWNKTGARGGGSGYQRPTGPRREVPVHDDDLGPVRPPNLHIEEIPYSDRPSPSRPPSGRSSGPRSATPRSGAPRSYSDRPSTGRPSAPRSYSDRSSSGRPSSGRPSQGRPDFDRPRPSSDRPRSDRPRPSSDRPASSRPSRPFSSEGGLPRAYTTSSGMPRAGGPRPSSKPGKPAGRSYSSGSRPGAGSIDPRTGSGYRPSAAGSRPSRPYTPRIEGASVPNTKKFAGGSFSRGTGPRGESPRREGAGGERGSNTGWKPKTRYGGPKKPGAGGYSKPGGSSKGAHKGKPGGKRPSSPGGKKRG
jgi:23S rRNA pseudouridine2605 synthase